MRMRGHTSVGPDVGEHLAFPPRNTETHTASFLCSFPKKTHLYSPVRAPCRLKSVFCPKGLILLF